MLYRSNLLALIPGGRKVEYAENVVLAYDLQKNDLCMDSAFKNKVRLSSWRPSCAFSDDNAVVGAISTALQSVRNTQKPCLSCVDAFQVLGVRLRRDKMVVVQARHIQIYSFPDTPVKISQFETGVNPHGLCELSPLSTSARSITGLDTVFRRTLTAIRFYFPRN